MNLNEEIARLTGWRIHEHDDLLSGIVSVWYNEKDNRVFGGLPDIEGNKCVALGAAEWMKEQGWSWQIQSVADSTRYSARFWKTFPTSNSVFLEWSDTLSLSIARAMYAALKSEAGK